MRDFIEIRIHVNNATISSLHETITSVIKQSNLNSLDVCIYIDNPNALNIKQEEARISNLGIKTTMRPSDSRFVLSIPAGEVISRSFLYKGYHYLLSNQAAFVRPEYTFSRIENEPTIRTIRNENQIFTKNFAYLIDQKKLSKNNRMLPRTKTILNTCSVIKPSLFSELPYIDCEDKDLPFLNNLFLSQKSTKDEESVKKHKHTFSFKQGCVTFLRLSAGRSKFLNKIIDVISGQSNKEYHPCLNGQLLDELDDLATINYDIKGLSGMHFTDNTNVVFTKLEQLFSAYSLIAKEVDFLEYQYITVLPWIISGGVDLFATNYINTISELHPDQNILILLTNDTHKSFTKDELGFKDNVTLLDLPKIFSSSDEYPEYLLPELIYLITNIFRPKRLHNIASKAGYDCIINYGDTIRNNGTKIIFSSYNYLTGANGEYMGYTVQELPQAYRPGDIVTTDNFSSKNLWVKHFGFLEKDILIHSQLFDFSDNTLPSPTSKDGLRILWAAHIRPEKNPEILPAIAKSIQSKKIDIDCYGLFSPIHWENGKNPLETRIKNLHYKGAYADFFKDIDLSKYDLFLYTSHADGTPNVIIEAALANLPIVASSIGGIPDALGDNAFLVTDTYSPEQFTQGIISVLSNLDDYKKKSTALQKELLAKHSKDNFIHQTEEMLERSK